MNRRAVYMRLTFVTAVALGVTGLVNVASADLIDSAIINLRVFNDDPDSVITTTNLYPDLISIKDEMLDNAGFANRHNFRLSSNGGISEHVFSNDDTFSFSADVMLTGPANSEGGLNLSPWWSQQVDGQFMLNAGSGEVAVFGGRLPFYSFTANHAVTYTKDTTVRLGLSYQPNGLSELDPATIEYTYEDDTGLYSSGILAFDEGNPDEDPPYGLWGILNDARLGGYFQVLLDEGNPDNWGEVVFSDMVYIPEPGTLALLSACALMACVRGRRS